MPVNQINSAINSAACSALEKECAPASDLTGVIVQVTQAPRIDATGIPLPAPPGGNERASANPAFHTPGNELSLREPANKLASLTLQEQQQWIESVKKAAPFLKDALDFILSYAKELKQEVFEDLATLVLNTTDNTADLVLIDRLADLTDWQRELLTNK